MTFALLTEEKNGSFVSDVLGIRFVFTSPLEPLVGERFIRWRCSNLRPLLLGDVSCAGITRSGVSMPQRLSSDSPDGVGDRPRFLNALPDSL